ncbi:MAG: glutamine synthetase type III, partial [Lachnospiraceae bacterium]|nr:glutamine synthetase type III [Lachnospiraceae bacterium]
NRTSPFAFTGNKFEFRSLGSSNSIACCNIMLNAAVAESLKQYADRLEGAADFESELHSLIKETIAKHERILFNGNGYTDEWVKEATEVRGLLNLRTTADAMPYLLHEKNRRMLTAHKVFTETELESRCEIMLENYCKTVNIEGLTMVDMVRKNYLPAIEQNLYSLAKATSLMKSVSDSVKCEYEISTLNRLSELTDEILRHVEDLEEALRSLKECSDITATSAAVRDEVLPKMEALRKYVDEAEMLSSEKCWPFPSYGKLLFSVY